MADRSNLVTTRAGITIGCAWQEPPPVQSDDADAIQAALLTERDRWHHFEAWLEVIDRAMLPVFAIAVCLAIVLGALKAIKS